MALVYDVPQEQLGSGVASPEGRNLGAEQAQRAGQASVKAGEAAQSIYLDFQNSVDTAMAKEMDNRLSEAIRTTLYDPEKGYLATKGKDALAARGAAEKALQEVLEGIEPALQNDVQKALFHQVAQQRMQAAAQQMDGHAMAQAKAYEEKESVARLEGAKGDMERAWFGWNKPGSLYQKNRAILESELLYLADSQGISEDSAQFKTMREKVYTEAHSNILSNMMSQGFAEEAKTYFDEAVKRGEISASVTDDLRERLEISGAATKADTLAEEVWNKATEGLGPHDAIKIYDINQEIRKRAGNDEKVQDLALAKIGALKNEWDAQQAEVRNQSIGNVWDMIDAGEQMTTIQKSKEWGNLTGLDRRQIEKDLHEERLRESQRKLSDSQRLLTELTVSDRLMGIRNWDLYQDMADPETLAKKSRNEVKALRPSLGRELTDDLLKKHEQLQKPGKLIEAKIDQDDFYTVAAELGLDPYSKNKAARRQLGSLKFYIERLIDKAQQAAGKELTREQKMELIKKEMSREVILERWGPDQSIPAMLLNPQNRSRVVVPPDKLGEIDDALREGFVETNGDPAFAPTDENRRRLYLKTHFPISLTLDQFGEE